MIAGDSKEDLKDNEKLEEKDALKICNLTPRGMAAFELQAAVT